MVEVKKICRCKVESTWYKIVDFGDEPGGQYSFKFGEQYVFSKYEHPVWGVNFTVVESVTGFEAGYDEKKFNNCFDIVE